MDKEGWDRMVLYHLHDIAEHGALTTEDWSKPLEEFGELICKVFDADFEVSGSYEGVLTLMIGGWNIISIDCYSAHAIGDDRLGNDTIASPDHLRGIISRMPFKLKSRIAYLHQSGILKPR